MIRLGGERDQLLEAYASVEAAGTVDPPWAMPDETRHPPLDADWPSFRHYG